MTGADAARIFYDETLFMREGAAPRRIQKTLFGEDGVQGMDGEAHRHRKHMFMSLMSTESIRRLCDVTIEHWHAYARNWESRERVVLFDQTRSIMCAGVCAWAGVPLALSEVEDRARSLGDLIDGSGRFGPRHWRARVARHQSERWIAQLIRRVRANELKPPRSSALCAIAFHRGLDGRLLDKRVASVELLNILRPTVAVARFVTFAAVALHEYPECLALLRSGGATVLESFVDEVRRYYPFFPFVVAQVRRDFEWKGYHFPQGSRVVLDLYGTNRDPRSWDDAPAFDPTRFRDRRPTAFDLIPQGGGRHYNGHRCAGEWITIELMKASVRFLTSSIRYEVPDQDLTIRLSRIPTLPTSRFVIRKVRRITSPGAES